MLPREKGERNERIEMMNSEERERKFSTLGTKVSPTILSSHLTSD